MSDYASGTIHRTLLQLKEDDWIGRSVLAREAAYLYPQAVQIGGQPARTTCPTSGCHASFTCNADLIRHIATIHDNTKKYTCPAVECFKHGTTPPAFSRADKLTDHIVAVHKQPNWRFICREVACEIEMHMTLAELVGHLETCREGRELHGKSAMRNALQRMQARYSDGQEPAALFA
ncbi:hypothetical protein LTR95_010219 [Oleoguttula sp. CCFEE 5521]